MAAGYLRAAITVGIHDVYLALAFTAVVTLVGVAVIVPRRFATTAGASASIGPGGDRPARPGARFPQAGKNPADEACLRGKPR